MSNIEQDKTHEPRRQGRVIAIVGRPNVGKSAIFNRLARKRVSIVHSQSGVTRDRVIREVQWGDQRFQLIDTGGIGAYETENARNTIESGIQEQSLTAIQDATVAILVTDVESSLCPLDESIARILRASGVTVAVAANKADNLERDALALDFDQLGFPVFPISALHNRGFDELVEFALKHLPDITEESIETPLRVAIAGRPNVGKSSYINRLLRSERVMVSDIPGTTRDPIDVPFSVGLGAQARHYILIDTAGMRRTGKIDSTVERFSKLRSERSISEADVVVLVLDALQGPTAQDKRIAAAIAEAGKGCVVLVNKWDMQETTQTQYGPELNRIMPFMGYCPVVFCSAKSGYNIRRTVDAIDLVASQITSRLPTGILNRAVSDICKRVNMPVAGGTKLRIYYATQVGTQPVRIRLFVNRAEGIQPNFRTFMIRGLRERFGLEGAPILLQFRSRRDPGNTAIPSLLPQMKDSNSALAPAPGEDAPLPAPRQPKGKGMRKESPQRTPRKRTTSRKVQKRNTPSRKDHTGKRRK